MICVRCQKEFDPSVGHNGSRRQASRKYCSIKCRKATEHAKNGWARKLMANYGMTASDYESMLSEQGDRCAVCRRTTEEAPKGPFGVTRLVVDHDHETGRVRGLLCTPCNVLLGMAQEDAEVLHEAIRYLEGART